MATVSCNNTLTLIKKYNNWNVCYTCGFDVEATHNLVTCLYGWRRSGHCKWYTRANTQSYINCGQDVCTKGIHKMMLPLAWWRGAENSLANKFNGLVSAIDISSLDPTENMFNVTSDDSNNDPTVVTSNCSLSDNITHVELSPRWWATAAHVLLGPTLHEALNALTIDTSHAIADMGATSIFIMYGIDIVNNWMTSKPLTINLPDGRKFWSTHICTIAIPGLPTVWLGPRLAHRYLSPL